MMTLMPVLVDEAGCSEVQSGFGPSGWFDGCRDGSGYPLTGPKKRECCEDKPVYENCHQCDCIGYGTRAMVFDDHVGKISIEPRSGSQGDSWALEG